MYRILYGALCNEKISRFMTDCRIICQRTFLIRDFGIIFKIPSIQYRFYSCDCWLSTDFHHAMFPVKDTPCCITFYLWRTTDYHVTLVIDSIALPTVNASRRTFQVSRSAVVQSGFNSVYLHISRYIYNSCI